MNNLFSSLEEEILLDEEICFDEEKIKDFLLDKIKINLEKSENKGFAFEEIVYDFLDFMNIPLIKTNKTRDFGVDGFIKLNVGFLGELNLGVQIKYKLIDSTDVDLFLSSLKNTELQLGVLVCKDSRELTKYELNSKIKSILLSKGISIKEKLLNDKIDINPVFVLKLEEILNIVTYQVRAVVKSIYKK
ncbi:restriction endonuclease [Candidatus Pacearchaeota archaeon]|nr:restriction endonuclease [Candidatus Pacearchaeota archaeon]